MASENLPYFAWCEVGEKFDPVKHRRIDDRPLKIVLSHEEEGRRTAEVTFPTSLGGEALEGREACHISVLVDGQIRHEFYGVILKSPNGPLWDSAVAEFEAQDPDDVQIQADLLAEIRSNPILYIPAVAEASDALDADTILAATTLQLEFDRNGVPFMCSIFGDPARVKTIDGSRIVASSFKPTFEEIVPRAAVGTLTLEWTQRRAVYVNAGDAIQYEIDRIGEHYGLPIYGANYTLTPGFVDQWPENGSTLGSSFVVINGGKMVAFDGPGSENKTPSSRPRAKVAELSEDVSGLPMDNADYGETETRVSYDTTGFTTPHLELFGVQSKARTEIVHIVVPFQGQQMKPDNAEPVYLDLSARDLDNDQTVEEFESGKEYLAGSRAKGAGMVFQSNVNQVGRVGLLNDVNDWDPYSSTLGTELWSPVPDDMSLLGMSDVDQAALSPFGRRAIQYMVRRLIVMLAKACRGVTSPLTIPVEDAWDLDTGSTVRIVSEFIKGGKIEGKVASWRMTFDISGGTTQAEIQIASAYGAGTSDDVPGEYDEDVETEGGDWDLVRYGVPSYPQPYVPLPEPETIVNARVDWLGCEQVWAITHPGQFVWDPYGKIPGPDGQYPARSQRYVKAPGGSAQKWVEAHATQVSFSLNDTQEDADPIHVYVPITYGWRGPRQVEL